MSVASAPIIMTARDAGAGEHIIALAERLRASGRKIVLLLQRPAADIARLRNIPHVLIEACRSDDRSSFDQQKYADFVKKCAPPVVVCGLSAFHETGIDEVLMLTAREAGIPSVAMQDFWGDVKEIEGQGADHYLVLDDIAADLTHRRVTAGVCIVGSPKHAHYAALDYHGERRAYRSRHGLDEYMRVVGFFGQDLMHLQGYRQMLGALADTLGALDAATLIYRPHPRESDASIARTLAYFREREVSVGLSEAGDVTHALCGVDVAMSCFSSVGLDAAYMMRVTGHGPAILYADYPEDVRAFWKQSSRMDGLPPVEQGYAFHVEREEELLSVLRQSCYEQEQVKQRHLIATQLPHPEEALKMAQAYLLAVAADRVQPT